MDRLPDTCFVTGRSSRRFFDIGAGKDYSHSGGSTGSSARGRCLLGKSHSRKLTISGRPRSARGWQRNFLPGDATWMAESSRRQRTTLCRCNNRLGVARNGGGAPGISPRGHCKSGSIAAQRRVEGTQAYGCPPGGGYQPASVVTAPLGGANPETKAGSRE